MSEISVIIASVLCLTITLNVIAIEIPSPPEILDTDCKLRSVLLGWSPTGNAVANEYKIQYKTNWSPNQWKDYGFKTPVKETKIRLILSPWANYTFRVMSVNNAGASTPSGESDSCVTEEDVPHMNPKKVYGRGNGPKNLVITWEPMAPIDQNAPGFFYTVYWRLNDVANSEWKHRNILDWQQHRLVIEDLPKLRPYRIKVEAHNSQGRANVEAQEVIGFSDEDKPSEAPKRLQMVDIIDGQKAHLKWDPIPALSINGHFKGYKVQVWTNSYQNITEQIVAANTTTALIDIFTPGVVNNVQVLAFNGAYDGPESNSIKLEMPVDVYPDPPGFMWTRITDLDNKPVIRIIYEPNVTNNNPGKRIYTQYRMKGIDTLDKWLNTLPEGVEDATKTDLYELEFDKYYEIRVVADSGKMTSFSNISDIDTHSKKWPKPSTTTTTTTPTPPPTLPPIFVDERDRVVPIDGNINPINTPTNKEREFQPDVNPENDTEEKSFSSSPWFIALICVIVFICAFVGVFMYLKRRRSASHEVNRHKSRVNSDKIRNNSKATHKTTDPKEVNSFIVDVSASRNGGVGHDEVDDQDDRRATVYNGTTETNH